MKKALVLILILAIGGAVYFFQGGVGLNQVNYNKVITYRLKDIFGFDFKIKKVELNDLNELVISELEVFGKESGDVAMLRINEIRGVYDIEKLKLGNEIFVSKAKISGITLPALEQLNIDKRRTRVLKKLNINFRSIFEEWDNKEEINKVLTEITSFYEKSKLSDLKFANREFEKAVNLENIIKATNLSIRPDKKSDLENHLKDLQRGVESYERGISPDFDYDPNLFLEKRFSSLVNKDFYELEMIKFLFDGNIKKIGKSLISNLRELYKAQFYSPEAQEKFPQLTFGKIELLEKLKPDSQNVMVGFLSNVSSKSSDSDEVDKIKILIQGDFEKYGIKGIDARIGIYKDNNKIITYNIMIKEVPIRNFVLFEDGERALILEHANGLMALKGIVHKAAVRGDFTYLIDELKFYRNPTIDNAVSRILDIFKEKDKKQLVIIMDDRPGKQSFIEVEYGDEYLEQQEFSPELTQAYNEDVVNAYFRDLNINSEEIKEKQQELKSGYQKTLSVIELIKSKLNPPTQ